MGIEEMAMGKMTPKWSRHTKLIGAFAWANNFHFRAENGDSCTLQPFVPVVSKSLGYANNDEITCR